MPTPAGCFPFQEEVTVRNLILSAVLCFAVSLLSFDASACDRFVAVQSPQLFVGPQAIVTYPQRVLVPQRVVVRQQVIRRRGLVDGLVDGIRARRAVRQQILQRLIMPRGY